MIRIGSLIRVKPEYEERYIILHRYPFPGVLKRIKNSHIRNYSIFLHTGILFSFHEYVGQDYALDMGKIAQDSITQDWWRLTDPMQEPLYSRKPGEWWATMPEVFFFENQTSKNNIQRCAFMGQNQLALDSAGLQSVLRSQKSIQVLSVFSHQQTHYTYLEFSDTQPDPTQMQQLLPLDRCSEWHSMQEVFHTD